MNCKLCHENLDAYHEGKLTPDMKTLVEAHLKTCEACSRVYDEWLLAERIIASEKTIEHGPFLATRIMAAVENRDRELNPERGLPGILRPVFITLSVAAALFAGVVLGKWSVGIEIQERIPVEFAMADDNALESVYLLSNE
mgnify:CR=1 FL=1|jgi:anti-sigma factor RsiW